MGALLQQRLALCLLMLLGSRLKEFYKDDLHGVNYGLMTYLLVLQL